MHKKMDIQADRCFASLGGAKDGSYGVHPNTIQGSKGPFHAVKLLNQVPLAKEEKPKFSSPSRYPQDGGRTC